MVASGEAAWNFLELWRQFKVEKTVCGVIKAWGYNILQLYVYIYICIYKMCIYINMILDMILNVNEGVFTAVETSLCNGGFERSSK